jgi:hypothetical protein
MDELARHRAKRRRWPLTPRDPAVPEVHPAPGDIDVMVSDLTDMEGMAVEMEAEAKALGNTELYQRIDTVMLAVDSALRLARSMAAEGGE